MLKRFIFWIKYRNHPCYLGGGEFDHDWVNRCDSDGYEIYTTTYFWRECRNCDKEAEIEDDDMDDFEDFML